MSGKKVAIIGAGAGGLTTAIYLARNGFEVKVFEKNASVGGRCSALKKDGHYFDLGATLLMMTDVYRQTWKSFGRELFDELDLIRMDPIYSIRFDDGFYLEFSSDLAKLQEQMERLEKGSFSKMLNYLNESYKVYQLSMKHIIDRDFTHPLQFFSFKNLLLMFRLHAFQNHYRQASNYFKDEHLRTTFTFQNIYVGQNPFKASAIFSMLPFLELTDGVWYPKGGMSMITKNLADIAMANGVEIKTGSKVVEITPNGRGVKGIQLEADGFVQADLVVSNCDLPHAYQTLLPNSSLARNIRKKEHTCSAFIFHWGLDRVFPEFEQHNVYVSNNYRENIRSVFEGTDLPEDTSFYVHAPARSDETAAPRGQDSISLLVPIGHIDDDDQTDWIATRDKARSLALKRLRKEGITDLEAHIKFERVYNPKTWQQAFHISKGSVFGSLSHKLMQMGYMRPHNQHPKYKNLFFVGGSTHPGNGIPMVLLSAKHTANRILSFTRLKTQII